MKFIYRHRVLMLLVTLYWLCVISLSAQNPVKLDTNPPPAAGPRSVVKSHGIAKATYDELRDETYAATLPIPLSIPNSGWGDVKAGFASKGKTVTKPNQVKLNIFIAAKDRSYVDHLDSLVVVDGKELFKGKATLRDGRTNGLEIYSSLEIPLSLTGYQTLVNGKKLVLAIGPSSWEVLEPALARYKDLIALYEEPK